MILHYIYTIDFQLFILLYLNTWITIEMLSGTKSGHFHDKARILLDKYFYNQIFISFNIKHRISMMSMFTLEDLQLYTIISFACLNYFVDICNK